MESSLLRAPGSGGAPDGGRTGLYPEDGGRSRCHAPLGRITVGCRLDDARFLRVHRSHIVNLDHVDELSEHDDRRLELRMRDGASVVASRSGSKELQDLAV